MQSPAHDAAGDSQQSVEDHDGGKRAAVEGGALHEGANDLEMLGRPIRFHELDFALQSEICQAF